MESLSQFPQNSVLSEIGYSVLVNDSMGKEYIDGLLERLKREISLVNHEGIYKEIYNHANDEFELNERKSNIEKLKSEKDSDEKNLCVIKKNLNSAKEALSDLQRKSKTFSGRITKRYDNSLNECSLKLNKIQMNYEKYQRSFDTKKRLYENEIKEFEDFIANQFIDDLEALLPEPRYLFNLDFLPEVIDSAKKNYKENTAQLEKYKKLLEIIPSKKLKENYLEERNSTKPNLASRIEDAKSKISGKNEDHDNKSFELNR